MPFGNRFAGKQLALYSALFVTLAVFALLCSTLPLKSARAAHESPHSLLLNRGNTIRPASTLRTNGKIAFGSKRDGNNEIYVMEADGGNPTRITNNFAYDDQPHWSPDGNKIAFFSRRDGNFELYSMNADGSNQTRLTNNFPADGFPAWSPDGTKIAFTSGDINDVATYEIYVMNADGSNQTRLTNNSVGDAVPAWSPDGTKIVFMSGRGLLDPNSFEIFVMDANGNNRTQLTNDSVMDAQPSFSVDGARILFVSGDAGNPPGVEVYVMAANGGSKTQLTHNSVSDGFPAWSPDGTKIVFASGDPFDDKNVELYVMNADGSNPTRLTNNSALDWFPDWQPVTPGVTTSVHFSSGAYNVDEGSISATITVARSGDTSGATTVDFASSDGTASQRRDYEVASGTLSFAAGETSKTFKVLIVDDVFIEGSETLNLTLSNPTGAVLDSPATATATINDNDTVNSTSPAAKQFVANLTGAEEVPATNNVVLRNGGIVQLSSDETSAKVSLLFSGLTGSGTGANIHGPAAPGMNALSIFTLPQTNPVTDFVVNHTAAQVADLKAGQHYMNVLSTGFPAGEIRGQLKWNPVEEAQYFVRQAYFDFLSRTPDAGGLTFWTEEITRCQSDVQCLRNKRVDVSNAFFYEQEYQQTASYVQRLYRAAYGNNQPFRNPNSDPNFPNEEKKMPSYAVFVADRARVVGGANLAQRQMDLANLFVGRPEFLTKYPASLATSGQFVDAVLATIQIDIGVNMTSQRNALLGEFLFGGRGNVMYRLADDNLAGPINNRALIDAEYNRAFVLGQYFGYLRRNPDIAGFVFWLNQVNSAPVRNVPKQHAMVCSFITAAEYQLRFGPVASRTNGECPQ
jgi:Tol biopolymer transport system component